MKTLFRPITGCSVKRGFTLVELSVTLAIVSVLTASLAPAIRLARISAAKTAMQDDAFHICLDAHCFKFDYGHYPESLEIFGDEFGLFESGEWVLQENGTVLIEGDLYRLYYTTSESQVDGWLQSLLSLDPDSEKFVDAVLAQTSPGPLLVLESIRPIYRGFGTTLIYMDVSTCGRGYVVLDLAKQSTQQDAVKTAALQAAATMLQNEVDPFIAAHEVPLILNDSETTQFVFQAFDRNADDLITLGEFSYVSRQLAEQEINDESSLGTRVMKQFFTVVVADLQLTSADDGNETVLPWADGSQDPGELFSYQNLCQYTELYVADDQTRDKLCRRLLHAQFLEEEDLLRPRDNVLTAQQRHLERLSGKQLYPEDAAELKILTEVRKGFGR